MCDCFLYHNIHPKAKVIYFERGLVARGGFVVRRVLSVPGLTSTYAFRFGGSLADIVRFSYLLT